MGELQFHGILNNQGGIFSKYRKFGDLGFDVSTFGVGCMRLPLKVQPDGTTDRTKIDEEEAIK